MDMDGSSHIILDSTTVGVLNEPGGGTSASSMFGGTGEERFGSGVVTISEWDDSYNGIENEQVDPFHNEGDEKQLPDDTDGGQLEQMGPVQGSVASGNKEGDNPAGRVRHQLQPHLERFLKQHGVNPRGSVGGSATYESNGNLFDQHLAELDEIKYGDTNNFSNRDVSILNMGLLEDSPTGQIDQSSKFDEDDYKPPSSYDIPSYDSYDEDFNIPPEANTGCSDYVTCMPDLMAGDESSLIEMLHDHDNGDMSRRIFAEFINEGDPANIPAPMVLLGSNRHSMPQPVDERDHHASSSDAMLLGAVSEVPLFHTTPGSCDRVKQIQAKSSWLSDCQSKGKEADGDSAGDKANTVIEVDQNSCKNAKNPVSKVQEKVSHWENRFSEASGASNSPNRLVNRQAASTSRQTEAQTKTLLDLRLRKVLAIMLSKIGCSLVDGVTGEAINSTKPAGENYDPAAVKSSRPGSTVTCKLEKDESWVRREASTKGNSGTANVEAVGGFGQQEKLENVEQPSATACKAPNRANNAASKTTGTHSNGTGTHTTNNNNIKTCSKTTGSHSKATGTQSKTIGHANTKITGSHSKTTGNASATCKKACDIPKTTGRPIRSPSVASQSKRKDGDPRLHRLSARPEENTNIARALFEAHAQLSIHLDEVLVNLLRRNNIHKNYEEGEDSRFRNTKAAVGVTSSICYEMLGELDTLLRVPRTQIVAAMKLKRYGHVFEAKRWSDIEIQKVMGIMRRLFSKIRMFYKVLPERSLKVSLVESATSLFDISHLLNALMVHIATQNQLHGEADHSFEAIKDASSHVTEWLAKEGVDIIETLETENKCGKIAMGKLKGTYPYAYERSQITDPLSGMTTRAAAGGNGHGLSAHDRKKPGMDRRHTASAAEHSHEIFPRLNEGGNLAKKRANGPSNGTATSNNGGASKFGMSKCQTDMSPASTSSLMVPVGPPAPNRNALHPLPVINQQQILSEAYFLHLVAEEAERFIKQMLTDGPGPLLGPSPAKG